jgi:hypothetical protein
LLSIDSLRRFSVSAKSAESLIDGEKAAIFPIKANDFSSKWLPALCRPRTPMRAGRSTRAECLRTLTRQQMPRKMKRKCLIRLSYACGCSSHRHNRICGPRPNRAGEKALMGNTTLCSFCSSLENMRSSRPEHTSSRSYHSAFALEKDLEPNVTFCRSRPVSDRPRP